MSLLRVFQAKQHSGRVESSNAEARTPDAVRSERLETSSSQKQPTDGGPSEVVHVAPVVAQYARPTRQIEDKVKSRVETDDTRLCAPKLQV